MNKSTLFASQASPNIEHLNTFTWFTQRKEPSNNCQMTHLRKEKNPEMDYNKIKRLESIRHYLLCVTTLKRSNTKSFFSLDFHLYNWKSIAPLYQRKHRKLKLKLRYNYKIKHSTRCLNKNILFVSSSIISSSRRIEHLNTSGGGGSRK